MDRAVLGELVLPPQPGTVQFSSLLDQYDPDLPAHGDTIVSQIGLIIDEIE